MASYYSFCIFILLLFSLCISKSGGLEVKRVLKTQRFPSISNCKTKPRKLDETFNQPITNPANLPPYTPTIVTIPGSNPSISPTNPTPTTTAPTTTVPATTTPTQPITNPANPGGTPVVYPVSQPTPTTSTPASSQGQTWCIAKTGVPENSLQDALDYACGIGGVDCSMIQEGGSCYNPNSLENHASFAFNSYYQKNPSPTSCDFGGTAVLVYTNPSSGTCIYPTSGSQAAVPLTTNPPTTQTPSSTFPTPTTFSPGTTGSPPPPYGVLPAGTDGSPPSLSNPSNNPNSLFPASYGPNSPPSVNSFPSGSPVLRPEFKLIIIVALFFTGKLILGI